MRVQLPASVAVAGPVALLLTTAAIQVALATTGTLSPWKGGGFGMFASIDGLAFREVRVHVASPDRSEGLLIPPSLEAMAARTSAFPHATALEGLARAVAARERRHGRRVTSVTVEVWRAAYSPTLASEWTRLAGRTVSIHADTGPLDR